MVIRRVGERDQSEGGVAQPLNYSDSALRRCDLEVNVDRFSIFVGRQHNRCATTPKATDAVEKVRVELLENSYDVLMVPSIKHADVRAPIRGSTVRSRRVHGHRKQSD
jgi:hypothetical protein